MLRLTRSSASVSAVVKDYARKVTSTSNLTSTSKKVIKIDVGNLSVLPPEVIEIILRTLDRGDGTLNNVRSVCVGLMSVANSCITTLCITIGASYYCDDSNVLVRDNKRLLLEGDAARAAVMVSKLPRLAHLSFLYKNAMGGYVATVFLTAFAQAWSGFGIRTKLETLDIDRCMPHKSRVLYDLSEAGVIHSGLGHLTVRAGAYARSLGINKFLRKVDVPLRIKSYDSFERDLDEPMIPRDSIVNLESKNMLMRAMNLPSFQRCRRMRLSVLIMDGDIVFPPLLERLYVDTLQGFDDDDITICWPESREFTMNIENTRVKLNVFAAAITPAPESVRVHVNVSVPSYYEQSTSLQGAAEIISVLGPVKAIKTLRLSMSTLESVKDVQGISSYPQFRCLRQDMKLDFYLCPLYQGYKYHPILMGDLVIAAGLIAPSENVSISAYAPYTGEFCRIVTELSRVFTRVSPVHPKKLVVYANARNWPANMQPALVWPSSLSIETKDFHERVLVPW